MKVFSGPQFDPNSLKAYFNRRIKKKGMLSKQPLETVEVSQCLWRPFRLIHWIDSKETELGITLVDESLGVSSLEKDEQLLLWRPRYVGLEVDEPTSINSALSSDFLNDDLVIQTSESLIKRRQEAQIALLELDPDSMGVDMQAAFSFLIPKLPASRRKRVKVEDEARPLLAIIRGTSMLAKVPQDAVIKTARIGERVFVGTYIAAFRKLDTDDVRFEVMETPGASSMKDAVIRGRPLTRLCVINDATRASINELLA